MFGSGGRLIFGIKGLVILGAALCNGNPGNSGLSDGRGGSIGYDKFLHSNPKTIITNRIFTIKYKVHHYFV